MCRVGLLVVLLCNIICFSYAKNIYATETTGILDAINNATDGDVIILQSGYYRADANNSNYNFYGRNLSFVSESGNPEDVIFDGLDSIYYTTFPAYYDDNATKPLYLDTYISISGITFKDFGKYIPGDETKSFGGVIYADSENTGLISIDVKNSVFASGYALYGGAIFMNGVNTSLNVVSSSFLNYTAYLGAGIMLVNSKANISDSLFDNGLTELGGGIYVEHSDEITVTNCRFTGNHGDTAGAAIAIGFSNFNITDSVFENNTALSGTIYTLQSTIVLTSSRFTSNIARIGGAIVNQLSHTSIYGSNFFDNGAASSGGAIFDDDGSDLVVVDCNFTTNVANAQGGAIFGNDAQFTISNSRFTENYAYSGGVFYLFGASNLNAENVVFSDNGAAGSGGVMLTDKDSVVYLKSSQLVQNTANAVGAAICAYTSNVTLEDALVSNNTASNSGGAFYIADNTYLQLISTKVDFNDAQLGSSLFCSGSHVTLTASSPFIVSSTNTEKYGTVCAEDAVCTFHSDEGNWANVCEKSFSTTDESASLSSEHTDDNGIAGWKIAVIVIVVLVSVAIIVLTVIFIVKKKREGGGGGKKNSFYQMWN